MPAFPSGPPVISREKLVDYLLSPTHPDGRDKARVFNAAGYSRRSWQILASDLVRALELSAPATGVPFRDGVKFIVPLEFTGPRGRTLRILTVWYQEAASPAPRLVTAYPRRVHELP